MIYRLLLISIASALILVSCGGDKATKDATGISANTLGLVESDLESDGEGLLNKMPEYAATAAGQSEKIDRAFENAPPMIPHMTDGFFPITKDNNICLTCHMPDKAEAVKAVPLPKTHFTDLRPAMVKDGNLYRVDGEEGIVVEEDLGDKLNSAYFNCNQCHVPQANVTVDIKNRFETVFRSLDSKSKSNLLENRTEGI